jgi:dTDP-4-dehydrorhamnose reductase
MRIFISGGSGLLGSKAAKIALEQGHEVFSGYAGNVPEFGERTRFDVTDIRSIPRLVDELAPDIVIHSAALTDVDRCETEKELAYRINVDGTRALAQAAEDAGSFLVYISTDYVFSGDRGVYRENDRPDPVNYYGYTKLLGEEFCRGCIARTCVIYGSRPSSGKVNFALWLINMLGSGRQVHIVTDQYITPTLNTNLAKMVLEAAKKRLCGVYHMAGATRISRYDFAVKIAEAFELDQNLILPSRMGEMRWTARRPKDSSLDTSRASGILEDKPQVLADALTALKNEVRQCCRE